MSKKQAEFWVALIVMCIIFAIAILLVDFGIKAAILEESNRLRLVIEEEVRTSGRNATGANAGRAANDGNNHPAFPADVLVEHSTGMEEGSSANGDTAPNTGTRKRRAQPARPSRPRTIPNGDK